MKCEIFGGFEIPRKANKKSVVDTRDLNTFWKDVDAERPRLASAIGCDVFALRKRGGGVVPWYVGKTCTQGFNKDASPLTNASIPRPGQPQEGPQVACAPRFYFDAEGVTMSRQHSRSTIFLLLASSPLACGLNTFGRVQGESSLSSADEGDGSPPTSSTSSSDSTSVEPTSTGVASCSGTLDGLTDCADCKACLTGWKGPGRLMSSDLSAPECPPQTVDALGELGSEPTFGELSCPACTCGDHEAPCIVASIYSDPNCTNEIFDIIGPFKGDICTPIAPPNVAPQYWKGHGDYPTTCPVLVDGEVASGPSSFAKKLRFCTSTSAPECTNAACVPNDDTEACIYTDGAAPCPPGFPNKLLAYDGFADQRSCTSCGCQPGLVRCEDPSNDFFVWDTEICGGNLIYQGNGFTPCQEVGLYPSYNLYTYGLNTTTTKGCTPIGGEVQGEITPSLPRTICCR